MWLICIFALLGTPCDGYAVTSVQLLANSAEPGEISAQETVEQARKLSTEGKLDEALHFYQQALQVFQRDGMLSDQAAMMSDIAVLLRRMGDVKQSLALQQQAVELYIRLGDVSGKAKGLRRIGVLHRHNGNFEDAIAAQEEALELSQQLDDQDGIAMVLINLGTIYGDLGRLEEARTYFDRALTIYTRLENQQGVSYTYGNLGQLSLYLGDSRQALHYLEQSLSLKQTLGDRRGQANALLNLGTVYRNTGEFQQALTLYYQTLTEYRDLSDNSGTAVALGHIGSVYEELGDLERALQFQLQSLELKKENGTPVQVTVALTNLASLAVKQQRFKEAGRYLEEALGLAVEQESLLAQAHIYGQRGNFYLRQEWVEEALADFTNALRLYTEVGSQKGQLEIYQYLGQTYLSRQDFDLALHYYGRGLQLAQDLDDRNSLWSIQYYLGQIALQQADDESALKYFIASVATLEHIRSYLNVPELRQNFIRKDANPYAQVIRLLLKKGEVKEALLYLERLKARTFLEVVAYGEPQLHTTPDILKEERYISARIRYLQEKLTQAAENNELLMAEVARGEKEKALSERIAQELYQAKTQHEELLLQIKLQYPKYYHLKIVDAEEIRQLVERAVDLIEPDVLLLEYFLDDDALHIWSIERHQITHRTVPVSRAAVLETVLQLRIETGYYFSDRVYPLLHTLYSWCIAPVTAQMDAKTTIGIVPFEILHFVPFGALTSTAWAPSDSETRPLSFPPYLIEEYALFSLPSLSVLPVVRNQLRQQLNISQQRELRRYVFGLGNATHSLPGAEQEILNITRQFDGSVGYTGQEATKQRLFDEAGTYEIIHLATHGVYDKQHPMFSYLELASEALYAREIFGLQLGANLVTLSGCETLLPQQINTEDLDALVSGDELVGFVRAFLYAGVPSVVSSLWRVNDAATQRLMETFYQQLPQLGKARSLQKAAQKVIRSSLEVGRRKKHQISLNHPFFWSSFVLVGDWK